MNTTSLALAGRPASPTAIASASAFLLTLLVSMQPPTSERKRPATPPVIRPRLRTVGSTVGSTASARGSRSSSRTNSIDSTAWYGTGEDVPATPEEMLDEIARRLNTAGKRLERFSGRCAQNVVMALLRPTPMVLLAMHPVVLLALVVALVWWSLAALVAS